MKTFLVKVFMEYGQAGCVVNASSKGEALAAAQEKLGSGEYWKPEGQMRPVDRTFVTYSITVLDRTTPGVVWEVSYQE